MTHESVDNYLHFLHELTDKCLNDASIVTFDKKHPQHLVTICLYGTIVELSTETLFLIENNKPTSLPMIIRSILEAYAGFNCCIKDPDHYQVMNATYLKEKLRMMETVIKNPGNPYLKGIVDSIGDPKIEKSSLEAQLSEIAAKGYSPTSAFGQFQKGGLKSEYQSLYWQLCLFAHNNVAALEDRHLNKSGDEYEVQFFKEPDANDLVRYLDTLCGLLIFASKNFHTMLESEAVSGYESWLEQLKELRTAHP